MATTVKELPGRTAGISADYVGRYVRRWRVEFDPPQGPMTARLAVPVVVGFWYDTPNEHDPFSFVQSIEAAEEGNVLGHAYIVTAQYGPWQPCGETPLLNPIEVEVSTYEEMVPIDFDAEGNAVVNSTGDPFDPSIEVPVSRPLITFVRNEPVFNVGLAHAVAGCVNEFEWRGFPPGTARSRTPVGVRQFHPACQYYWRCVYAFEINMDGWKRRVLDAGLRRLGPDGKPKAILISEGAVKQAVPLDGSGQPLDPAGDPYILEFTLHPPIDFAVFDLDDA